jgi:hypothetical protein
MKNIYTNTKFLFLLLVSILTMDAFSQVTVPFTTSGTWVCPAGVTTIQFEAYGAGGGSGGGNNASNKRGGGGGGGGAYALHNAVTVVPGTTYTITVGTGGTAGTTAVNGGNGGLSRGVFGGLTITANGGIGGQRFNAGAAGGAGGTATNGTTNRTGGAGGTGSASGSGGGGGGAGTTGVGGAGGAGGTTTGGTAGGGAAGAGGAAKTGNDVVGNAGVDYGGGAGGGTNTKNGAAGADGYALITYTAPAPAGSTCATAVALPCGTTNLAGTTVGTTGLGHGTTCSISNYGIWYTFVGDGQLTTISTTASYDIELSINSGTCGTYTNLACNDNGSGTESYTFTSTVGVNYYVYVAYYSSGSSITGTFDISRTCCTSPTMPAAGPDQYLADCVTTTTMAANVAAVGTGTWTCQSGCTGVTIASPNSPTTSVTLGAAGPTRLRWTIANGCATNPDNVDIYYNCPPTNNTCADAATLACGTTNLAVSTVGATDLAHGTSCDMSGYGVWYKFVGDGQTTTISVGSSYDIELSINSGSCGSFTNIICTDFPESHTFPTVAGVTYYVYIAYYSSFGTTTGTFTLTRTCCASPTIANAGVDISAASTSATMAANTATVGTGTWTCVSGCTGLTITNANSPTATINGVANATNAVLRWTIANACTSTYDQVTITNTTGVPATQLCSGAINLPCGTTNLAGTTVGTVDLAHNTVCSMSNYGRWYTFVGDGNVNSITTTTGTLDVEISVNSGSCGALTNIDCEDLSGSETVTFPTTVGVNYYVYVSYWLSGTTTGTFTISRACISCASGLGANNVNVTLPYSAAGLTTAGAGDELTASTLPTCGSTSYSSGEDKIFIFTPATSGNVTATLTTGSQGASMKLYEGCPYTGTCVTFVESTGSEAKTFCTYLTAGTAYYLVVDSYDLYVDNIPSFTLSISSPAAGATNELPCGATLLTNGTSVSGDNRCTSGTSEPGVAPCWSSGNLNTVWYKFQASSTSMYIRTTLTTIASTQVAVYSGTCGALTFLACNDDAPATGCAGSTNQFSILDLTGLTLNAWYWVRVDGDFNDVGTFNIILNDGVSINSTDAVLGQDCSNPVPICANVQNVANPSYAGTGNKCDFTGTNNCTSGEKNSVWYSFEIATTGNLNFTIFPNDATNNSNGAETDYDWVLWKLTNADGTSNTSCSTLNSAAPAACNYGTPGITGLAPGGNAPAPIDAYFNSTFEPSLAVTAGERYALVIQNFETTASGFNLDFSTSTAGAIDGTPSTIYWAGATNNSFTTASNYGTCSGTPACGINVVISNGPNQPLITGTTTQVKDLTINPGATLTFAANSKLQICGTLTNNGTIICPASSTIEFIDGSNTTQSINGTFNGASNNRFGNLVVTKAAGSVTINNDINVGGNFTTTNSTSVFNSNNKYVKVAGHFTNATGNTTFTNTGTTGTLEFNGSGLQNYNQGSSVLDLNKVVVNNSAAAGSGVTLATNMNIKATTGTLTLTSGTVTTGGTLNTGASATITGGYKVIVNNTTANSVNAGNVSSYVDGSLVRYLGASGIYEWPMGHAAAKGYQRATTNFSANTIGNVECKFTPWPLVCTLNSNECTVDMTGPSFDNGMWTFLPSAGTCTYTANLYPLNVGNYVGDVFSIIKRPHTSAITNTGWIFDGSCVAGDSSNVSRSGMSGFSFLGVDQNLVDLPIELISFEAVKEGTRNKIEWTTSSERDNDFFTVEKSKNNG